MNLFAAVLFILPFTATGADLESTADRGMTSSLVTKSYARFSMSSSRTGQKGDFRSLKTTGADDSGGVSEQTTLPNQSIVAAFGFLELARKNQLMFAAIQSVDSEESRKVKTPYGTQFVLPGRIAVARYRHALSEAFGLSLGMVHVDTFGFSDPSFGLGYRNYHERGGTSADLQLSAPTSQRSRGDELLTKATLRIGAVAKRADWTLLGRLSHSRPFYQNPEKLDKPPASSALQRSAVRVVPSEGDLVLMQKESSRSTATAGTFFQVSSRLRLGMSGQIVYLTTFKEKTMWTTALKPLSAAYTMGQWELGASFSLSSKVEKYKAPSLPSNWAAAANLSYAIGQAPGSI